MYSPVCVDFINDLPYKSDEMHTLRSQMNVIINPNSQQHAEIEFETLHTCKFKFLWNYCELSRCETHVRNLHACT